MIQGREKLVGLYEPWRVWCLYWLTYLDQRGFGTIVTSGFRDLNEQKVLYDEWRAGRRRLPAAAPGKSAHNYGLAIDVWASNGQQAALMTFLREAGGETVRGDPPHIQYPGSRRYLGS